MKQQQQQQGAKQSLTDSEAFLYQKIETMEQELTNDNSFRWKTTIIKNKELYEPSFWDLNLILTIILAGFLLVVFLCISKSSSSVPMNNNNNTFVRGSTNEDLSNKLIRLGSTNNTTTTNANATDAISVLEHSNTTTTTTTTNDAIPVLENLKPTTTTNASVAIPLLESSSSSTTVWPFFLSHYQVVREEDDDERRRLVEQNVWPFFLSTTTRGGR
mmetsp:Transcript_12300/g.18998  ORF Transcript_12300/g.18998 Transcript_12300/m.18998 type:complete len:216 (-) Transcript_12300:136-783(-)